MQLSHMIPGMNIIGGKVSVASRHGAGRSGGVLRLYWGFTPPPKKIFRL